MQIAVISDLHLGGGDRSDGFGHDDSLFERFLMRLETDFDRIVLLGDIWETLTTQRPYSPREGLKRAREAHARLARRMQGSRYLYVHGNHDAVAGHAEQAPSELVIDDGGGRLLFTHGHHYDWLLRHAGWLSEGCVWLGGWARRLQLNGLYRLGYALDSWRSYGAQTPRLDGFQRWTLALAKRRSVDIVVTGHTHQVHRVEREGRWSLNSGRCCDGALSYLAIDTRAGIFSVVAESPQLPPRSAY